jgi:hypothetical protein
MPDWWRRTGFSKRRVPDSILAAAAGSQEDSAETVQRPGQNLSEPPAVTLDTAARDFPAQVEALRRIVDDDRAALERLRGEHAPADVDFATWQGGQAARISAAQATYKTGLEILRKAENDLLSWQEAHGELVSRSQVASEVSAIVAAIVSATGRLLDAFERASGKAFTPAERQQWKALHQDCFRSLTASRFGKV